MDVCNELLAPIGYLLRCVCIPQDEVTREKEAKAMEVERHRREKELYDKAAEAEKQRLREAYEREQERIQKAEQARLGKTLCDNGKWHRTTGSGPRARVCMTLAAHYLRFYSFARHQGGLHALMSSKIC